MGSSAILPLCKGLWDHHVHDCTDSCGNIRNRRNKAWYFVGILAGILDALPFIGTGIVLVPLGVFQILEEIFGRAFVCGVLYVVCIFLREILEPRLIGRKIGVSPIAVLVSLYAGIRLFGVWGIIKGPLGFVLIYETYHSLSRMSDRQREGTTGMRKD